MSRAWLSIGVLLATLAAPVWAESGPNEPDQEEQLWRHRNLGKAFYENSATQFQAVEEFEKALALAPDSARSGQLRPGAAAGRQEDEGIAQLEQAQAQDPSIPHTWFNLGIAYKRAGALRRGPPPAGRHARARAHRCGDALQPGRALQAGGRAATRPSPSSARVGARPKPRRSLLSAGHQPGRPARERARRAMESFRSAEASRAAPPSRGPGMELVLRDL